MFEDIFKKAIEGDVDAKEEIIRRFQPLIISSIRRYYNKREEYEDLIQDGNIKILESFRDYDSEKDVHFLGYIKLRLKYLYLDKHKVKIHHSLNEVLGDGEVELIDLIPSDDMDILDGILQNESYEDLRKALDSITDRQREIVLLYYVKRMKMEDIAAKLNVSYRTVVNTKTRAIENLRKIKE